MIAAAGHGANRALVVGRSSSTVITTTDIVLHRIADGNIDRLVDRELDANVVPGAGAVRSSVVRLSAGRCRAVHPDVVGCTAVRPMFVLQPTELNDRPIRMTKIECFITSQALDRRRLRRRRGVETVITGGLQRSSLLVEGRTLLNLVATGRLGLNLKPPAEDVASESAADRKLEIAVSRPFDRDHHRATQIGGDRSADAQVLPASGDGERDRGPAEDQSAIRGHQLELVVADRTASANGLGLKRLIDAVESSLTAIEIGPRFQWVEKGSQRYGGLLPFERNSGVQAHCVTHYPTFLRWTFYSYCLDKHVDIDGKYAFLSPELPHRLMSKFESDSTSC
ncbi:MAG: hypothetical protein OES24_22845 [Acidimicrobiia bacterium]|nr:hypothetical protein [Acidimicrobiia bacterium]